MNRDQFPWRDLTTSEVLALTVDGFNTHEVAWIAGVSDARAEKLISDAVRTVPFGQFPPPLTMAA